jgi:hypothetical protein
MKKLILAVCMALAACVSSPPPTPFKPGAVTDAPIGCKEGQVRGVEC